MNCRHQASVSNVRQKRRSKSQIRGARTLRISARVDETIARSKPAGMSWGDFITALVRRGKKTDIYALERVRQIAWSCNQLTELTRRLPPRDAGFEQNPVDTDNRWQQLAQINEKITAIHRILEGLADAD